MTDSTDRVEDLERRVAELEATVKGLTEELVDRTERIRTLEEAVEADPAGLGHVPEADSDVGVEVGVPGETASSGEESTDGEAEAVVDAADSDMTEERTDSEDAEGSETDDIIVA
ncbi:MAG: hypothetical protein ABEJ70_00505 [Halobacteriaceae archaeon]